PDGRPATEVGLPEGVLDALPVLSAAGGPVPPAPGRRDRAALPALRRGRGAGTLPGRLRPPPGRPGLHFRPDRARQDSVHRGPAHPPRTARPVARLHPAVDGPGRDAGHPPKAPTAPRARPAPGRDRGRLPPPAGDPAPRHPPCRRLPAPLLRHERPNY